MEWKKEKNIEKKKQTENKNIREKAKQKNL